MSGHSQNESLWDLLRLLGRHLFLARSHGNSKLPELVPAPYGVAVDLAESRSPPIGSEKMLTLRRYFWAATITDGARFHSVITGGQHFGTYAAAQAAVPDMAVKYPGRVTSLFLEFDPEIPEQLEAYLTLSEDVAREAREFYQ